MIDIFGRETQGKSKFPMQRENSIESHMVRAQAHLTRKSCLQPFKSLFRKNFQLIEFKIRPDIFCALKYTRVNHGQTI